MTITIKATRNGILATAILLAFYFTILTLVSGWSFTIEQFQDNWYWIVALTLGFGTQVGLVTYARFRSAQATSRTMVATSGATSATAMIACCTHYLVNLLPILGVTGIVTFVAQYQPWLYAVGLASNLLGIGYILSKIRKLKNNI